MYVLGSRSSNLKRVCLLQHRILDEQSPVGTTHQPVHAEHGEERNKMEERHDHAGVRECTDL